jgi:peptide/nickel transport system permease protein
VVAESPARPSRDVLGRRLLPGIAVLGALGVFALMAPLFGPGPPSGAGRATASSYSGIHLEESLRPPSASHPFGTDALGRDLLARVVQGARVSLAVGFGATLLALVLGALLGGTAALQGGLIDLLLGRIIEILGCFPPFVLALALVTVAGGSGLMPIVMAIGLSRAASAARFIRGEVQRRRGSGLWVAARASGAGLPRLAFRHLLPQATAPLIVQAAFGVAQAILLESSLSFLGLGVQPPAASWGMILAEGRATLEIAWWPILFPSGAIMVTLAGLEWAGSMVAPSLWCSGGEDR